MSSQCSGARNKTLTPSDADDMEALNMSEECFASPTPSLSGNCEDSNDKTMDRYKRIQELTNGIIAAITAGKSVTAENKKVIINMAHDIDRLNRESIHEYKEHTNLTDIKDSINSLRNTITEELVKNRETTTAHTPAPAPTYATVTNSGKSPAQHKTKPKTRPTIVISPTNSDMPRQAVAECWRRSVPYKEINYAPISVRPVAKNKLKIEFDSINERDDALKRLQNAKDIKAESGKKLRPMIELKGISKEITTTPQVQWSLGRTANMRTKQCILCGAIVTYQTKRHFTRHHKGYIPYSINHPRYPRPYYFYVATPLLRCPSSLRPSPILIRIAAGTNPIFLDVT